MEDGRQAGFLLAGNEPPAGLRWNSSFAFTGFKPRADVPIYLAGLSPAMLRLAGEIADGVVLWACPASYVKDVVTREVAAGRARTQSRAMTADTRKVTASATSEGRTPRKATAAPPEANPITCAN